VEGVPATVFRAAFQSIIQGLYFAQIKFCDPSLALFCVPRWQQLAIKSIQLFPLELKEFGHRFSGDVSQYPSWNILCAN
jgi:hypothetical protein